jgi:hypothetical protein
LQLEAVIISGWFRRTSLNSLAYRFAVWISLFLLKAGIAGVLIRPPELQFSREQLT